MRQYIIVDLDGTLTIDIKELPYPEKPLNTEVAEAVHAAQEAGYGVMVLTARGMRTWKNDRQLVETHVRPGVEAWLRKHELAPDEVQVGKPWCGPRGFYVDDRNLHPEEFRFRFSGPWAGEVVQGMVRGRAPDLHAGHARLMRCERWLDLCGWDYLDDPRAKELSDVMVREGDGRAARWALIVHQSSPYVDPAGWFAYHHERVRREAVVVQDSDGGFALVPMEWVEQVGTELADLSALVGSR